MFNLSDDVVPMTARNFRELALGHHGFGYKGSKFNRIIPQFIIQGGECVTLGGSGNKSIFGEAFQGMTARLLNVGSWFNFCMEQTRILLNNTVELGCCPW